MTQEGKINLLVIFLIPVVVILPLWLINVISYHKSLRKLSIPQIFRSQMKILTISQFFAPLLSCLGKSIKLKELIGRQVFAIWDVRWGGHGETMGKIIDVVETQQEHNLIIELKDAMEFSEKRVGPVIFSPFRNKINLRTCFFVQITGFIRVKNGKGDVIKSANCDIIIYR